MTLNIFSSIFLIALFFVSGLVDAQACLECLCEMTTSCNPKLGCNNGVCGMYALTEDYWIESGSPTSKAGNVSDSKNAFQKCATDPECARLTVKMYIGNHSLDCNNDGFIDCLDYAPIQKFGKENCTQPLGQFYKRKLYSCLAISSDLDESFAIENEEYEMYEKHKKNKNDKNDEEMENYVDTSKELDRLVDKFVEEYH